MLIEKYTYFLLDYDGLLVDSEKLDIKTWCRVLTKKGQKICFDFYSGKHESETYEKVKKHLKTPMSLKEVSIFRKSIFDNLISSGKLNLMEDIEQLLERLKDIAPMSIVSNSTKDFVMRGLKLTGIENFFDNLFCYSDGINRKPSPDLYDLATLTLNLNKHSTLAFEDSKTGIMSAQRANIPVLCINTDIGMKEYCEKENVPYYYSANAMLQELNL